MRRFLPNNYGRFVKAGGSASAFSTLGMTGTGYLTMSNANFGAYTRAKFAISMWVRRLAAGVDQSLWCKGAGAASDTEFELRFTSGNTIQFITYNSGSTEGNLVTTATYTSTSAFYHILAHHDSGNATAGDRMRLWVDGSEVTGFGTDTNPSTSPSTLTDNPAIGGRNGGTQTGHILLHQVAFFDNVLPAVTDLRDSTTGKPINPAGQAGLYSLVTGRGGVAGKDNALSADWTENGLILPTNVVP